MKSQQLNVIVPFCFIAALAILHGQTSPGAKGPPHDAASFNAHHREFTFALQPGETSGPVDIPVVGQAFRITISFTRILLREGAGTEPPFEGGPVPPFFADLLCLQESANTVLLVRAIPGGGYPDNTSEVELGNEIAIFSVRDFPFRLQLQTDGTLAVENLRNAGDGYSVSVHIALWY